MLLNRFGANSIFSLRRPLKRSRIRAERSIPAIDVFVMAAGLVDVYLLFTLSPLLL